MPLTGRDNFFEDFRPGDRVRHARGKTITDLEVATLCHLVMNTAQGHFNEQLMAAGPFGGRIAFGGITASVVVGLASQDTAENALAELGLDKVRFRSPVRVGDTLHALTEVVGASDAERDDAGVVTFRHWGINQRDEVVFEGERRVLLKRRSHWEGR